MYCSNSKFCIEPQKLVPKKLNQQYFFLDKYRSFGFFYINTMFSSHHFMTLCTLNKYDFFVFNY